MRADRVIRQKSHTAARVLRKAWTTGQNDGVLAGVSVLGTTARALLRPRTKSAPSEFDRAHGVDTSGIVPIAAMDVKSANYVHGIHYQASKPDELRSVLDSLPLNHAGFTFVDYGSGKGMALLVASLFPFRRIVGVEFAADLHRIAEKNIAAFRAPGMKCRNIESVNVDATEWSIPDEPLICYFYEPFETPVLARVIENLSASWSRNPRPMVLAYHQATAASLLYEGSLKNQRVIVEGGLFQATPWLQPPYAAYTAGVNTSAATRPAHTR